MKLLLTFFLICFSSSVMAQEKKLEKIFSEGYQRIDASKPYPFNETDSQATIIQSNTFLGDTSGIVYDNELVNFRFNRMKLPEEVTYYHSEFDSARNVIILTPFDTVVSATPIIRFIKETPVSVAEYLAFQNWVRDSLARDELYLDTTYLSDQEALKMLHVYIEQDELEGEYKLDPSDRERNRSFFTLDWSYPLKYDFHSRPEKTSLYISTDEQFNGKIEFDQRKLNYQFTELTQFPRPESAPSRGHKNRMRYFARYITPTFVDTYAWMNYAPRKRLDFEHSQMNRKEWGVLSQLYLEKFPNEPIIGITGMQARAYCDWKETQIRSKLMMENLPYDVEVSLISVQDLKTLDSVQPFKIPEYNPTENWRITVAEYAEFMNAVRDSIGETEDNKNPCFNYTFIDEYERSIVGTLEAQFEPGILEAVSSDTMPYLVGMDLNLGYENDRGQSSGVRSHKYLKTLYVNEIISILPEIDLEKQEKNASVQGITYSQALAFYNWKYPIWKANSKDNWLKYVIPTQEEFEKVQRGEEIVVPAKEVEYPTPTFRFAVHLIRYEDEE